MNHPAQFLRVAGMGLLLGSLLATARAETVDFQSGRNTSCVDHVEVTIEVAGQQKQIDEKNQWVNSDMRVTAGFEYDERTLRVAINDTSRTRTIRSYDKAGATISFDDMEVTPILREDRRIIVSDWNKGKLTLFSPNGPLTTGELDLINVHGNSMLLDQLLPTETLAEGDKFTPSRLAWGSALRLDLVAEFDCEAEIVSVDENTAMIETKGKIEGAVDGAETQIDLHARMQYSRKAKRVTWFAMVIEEERSVGQIGPGLDVAARVQVKLTPTTLPDSLSDAVIDPLQTSPESEVTSLAYTSPIQAWNLAHDRQWIVTQEDEQFTVLRLMEQGELVAQCNITALPPTDVDKMLTLEDFQKDIESTLSENKGQVVTAGQRANGQDYREYKIIADGQSQELPIRWIYYLLTDRNGHQAMLAFALHAELFEQFDDHDARLVDAFRFNVPGESGSEEPVRMGANPEF